EWLAIIDTLGRPFRPFFFWNNTGPRVFEADDLPFSEQIGTRGSVVTFKSAFRDESAWRLGLEEDLRSLLQLPLGQCGYGAAGCPIHPFVCELDTNRTPLRGTDVLRSLRVSEFRSDHMQALDATAIPSPGYQPGTNNDEIHNDQTVQKLFPRPEDITEVT